MNDISSTRTAPACPSNGQGASRRGLRLTGGTLVAALLLGACSEKEVYLPGKREDIRSVLQSGTGQPQEIVDTDTPNRAQAISLPPAQVNAEWTHTIGTPRYRVPHPALSATPRLAWSADIGAGDSRKLRITADPVVANGRIYTLDAGARVTATSTSGATLWSRDLTPATDAQGQATGGGLVVEGGTLYVSSGFGILAALDAATGAQRWQQELDATGSGTPTVYGDLVYLTAGDDTGWAVEKSNGRIAWQIGASTDINNVLGAPAPAVTDTFAIFGFGSGEVKGVFRQGGVGRWDTAVVGRRPGRALASVSDVTSAPVVSGNTVYVGNQSGRLAALDMDSGDRRWTVKEGAVGPVLPVGGSVFAITDLNRLIRLDAATGARIWSVALPYFVKDKPKRQSEIHPNHGPILAGGRLIVASGDGFLRSYDPVSGALTGSVALPGGATTAPVVAGRTLYVVSADGQLHAFR